MPPGQRALPGPFRDGRDAAAVPRRRPGDLTCPSCGARWRSSAPSRSTSTPTPPAGGGQPAADRPQLVPDLRGDGRVRHPGDGARQHVVQPGLPHDRRRTTSTPTPRRSCSWCRATSSRTSRPCDWSSPTVVARSPTTGAGSVAWRWRSESRSPKALLGNVLVRHLRLPPARHRPADPASIPSEAILFASEMIGAVRGRRSPRPGTTSTTPSGTSTRPPASPTPSAREPSTPATRCRVYPRLDRAARRRGLDHDRSTHGAPPRSASSTRRSHRADPAAVEALSAFGVATVHEAMGRVGLMRPYIRPVYRGARLCGPAVTVLLQPGDNWMLHVAAEQVRDGDVLVAALHDRERGRLLRRASRHVAAGTRMPRPGHRRRSARRRRPRGDGLPGVLPRRQRQGHGQGDAGIGQRPRRLCECPGPPG